MGEMIRMTMDDGAEIAVYHAEARGERRGGLVLIQEIFGVTDHIREMCDEYAAEGYEVLSPALFDREHPGFESDYSGPQFERAVQLARELHPFEQSLKDAQTCIDALKGKGPVFITGYCYGGSVAWRMAQVSPDLAAASAYYGSLVPTMFADEAPSCAAIAHFGRYDDGIPMAGVEALIAKDHPTAQLFVYEAGHGFNSDRRKDYHEASADLAKERTLMLFKACGGVKLAVQLLLALLVFALVATAFLYTQQRRLLFPAPANYPQTAPEGFRLVHTTTGDGLRLSAFYRPAAPGRKTILFFHGNGDTMLGAIEATRGPAAAGSGLLLAEYRGYAGNPGSPGEAGLYRDGDAAMRWLAGAGVDAGDVVVVGNSIGSGPATQAAARHRVAALVLVSGFSDLPSVVQSQLPLIPRWLVRDRFDNAAKLPRVTAPVYLMHGDADTLVKPDNLDRLRAARPDATVALVAGAGHELAYTAPAQAILTRWIAALP